MGPNEPSALIDFALLKWEADPNVRIEDAYKWLYQATRGGEHLVSSPQAAAGSLEREWGSVGPVRKGELLWEVLRPDHGVGRLNIRPFKDTGGKIEDLVDAFVASSKNYEPVPPGSFQGAWNELGRRLETRPIGHLGHAHWGRLNAEMKAKSFPAIHHSDAYRAALQPAYRVLTAAEARRLVHTGSDLLHM